MTGKVEPETPIGTQVPARPYAILGRFKEEEMHERFVGTMPVQERHRFDVASLERYLTTRIHGLRGPLEIEQFRGGQSNPTFLLRTATQRYVLRRKPPGKLLPSAHAVDREYRESAAAERLPLIAPRRFNPEGRRWLPILHTTRNSRHYTALFSNTARAHELGRTNDWVVIYCDRGGSDGQWTVVTSRTGVLRGRRVVRGRERECERYYGIGPPPQTRLPDIVD